MATVVKRYPMKQYQDNPVWLLPVLLLGGGVAAYFGWEKFKKEVGVVRTGRVISTIPGVAGAAIMQWMVKPKIGIKYKKYADYGVLALLGYAGYSALTYSPSEETEEQAMAKRGYKGKTEVSFTNVEAGQLLGKNYGFSPIVKVDISPPSVGKLFDAIHFRVTNIGVPKNVVWRIEGKPTWGAGGAISDWGTGSKQWLKTGEIMDVTENVYFWTWQSIDVEKAKYQFRIVLAADETFAEPKIYMKTPWYNHYSE